MGKHEIQPTFVSKFNYIRNEYFKYIQSQKESNPNYLEDENFYSDSYANFQASLAENGGFNGTFLNYGEGDAPINDGHFANILDFCTEDGIPRINDITETNGYRKQLQTNIVNCITGCNAPGNSIRLNFKYGVQNNMPEGFIEAADDCILKLCANDSPLRKHINKKYACLNEKGNFQKQLPDENEQAQLDDEFRRLVLGELNIKKNENFFDLNSVSDNLFALNYTSMMHFTDLAQAIVNDPSKSKLFNDDQLNELREAAEQKRYIDARMEYVTSDFASVVDYSDIGQMNMTKKTQFSQKLRHIMETEQEIAIDDFDQNVLEAQPAIREQLSPLLYQLEEDIAFTKNKYTSKGWEIDDSNPEEDYTPFGMHKIDQTVYRNIESIYAMLMDDFDDKGSIKNAEKIRNFILARQPVLNAEQYRQLYQNKMPGFRPITDPAEKAQRYKTNRKAIDAFTLGIVKTGKLKNLSGTENLGLTRDEQAFLIVLDENRRNQLLDYVSKRKNGTLNENDKKQYADTVHHVTGMLFENKQKLIELSKMDPERFIEEYPKYFGIANIAGFGDDILKYDIDPPFSDGEKRELSDFNSIGSSVKARVARLMAPEYATFDTTDFAKCSISDLIDANDTVEAVSTLEGTQIGNHDVSDITLYEMSGIPQDISKAYMGRNTMAVSKISRAVGDQIGLVEPVQTAFSYADFNGKQLSQSDAIKNLEAGKLIYAKYDGNDQIVPIFTGKCILDEVSDVLSCDKALQAAKELYNSEASPEKKPIDPRPTMTLEQARRDDVKPTGKAVSFANFFYSAFHGGKNMKSYDEYKKKLDDWNERDRIRRNWEAPNADHERMIADYNKAMQPYTATNANLPESVLQRFGSDENRQRTAIENNADNAAALRERLENYKINKKTHVNVIGKHADDVELPSDMSVERAPEDPMKHLKDEAATKSEKDWVAERISNKDYDKAQLERDIGHLSLNSLLKNISPDSPIAKLAGSKQFKDNMTSLYSRGVTSYLKLQYRQMNDPSAKEISVKNDLKNVMILKDVLGRINSSKPKLEDFLYLAGKNAVNDLTQTFNNVPALKELSINAEKPLSVEKLNAAISAPGNSNSIALHSAIRKNIQKNASELAKSGPNIAKALAKEKQQQIKRDLENKKPVLPTKPSQSKPTNKKPVLPNKPNQSKQANKNDDLDFPTPPKQNIQSSASKGPKNDTKSKSSRSLISG